MKNEKLTDKKLFLKSFWWFILLSSIGPVIFTDGYIGLNEGFDWSFIQQPKSYLKLIFYIFWWTVGYYLLFWRPNRKNQNTKTQQLESKDQFGSNSLKN